MGKNNNNKNKNNNESNNNKNNNTSNNINNNNITILKDAADVSDRVPRFKVALLGEAGVGKTSMFLRIRDNEYKDGPPCTIGIDSCNFGLKLDNAEIKVALWDTAGVERFRTLTRNFYRNAHAVLLCFNVNNPSTLYHLSKWEEDAARYAPSALRFLVGCKNDLETLVTKECVENFAKSHGCEYAFFTSAKTGQGIPEALAAVAHRLISVHCQDRSDLEASWLEENVNINKGDNNLEPNKTSSCC